MQKKPAEWAQYCQQHAIPNLTSYGLDQFEEVFKTRRATLLAAIAVLDEPASPLVERFARDPEPTARPRDIVDRGGMLQDLRSPGRDPTLLCLCHRLSTLGPRAEKGERNVSPY